MPRRVLLYNLGCGWHRLTWIHWLGRSVHNDLAIGINHGTLARYVPALTTFVAYFAGCIQDATVRSGTVTRNMALIISVTLIVFLGNELHIQSCRMHSIS